MVKSLQKFGNHRKLKEKDIPGPQDLRPVHDVIEEKHRVRGVHDDEPLDGAYRSKGENPCNRAAPVMPDEQRRDSSRGVDQSGYIREEVFHRVVFDLFGPA